MLDFIIDQCMNSDVFDFAELPGYGMAEFAHTFQEQTIRSSAEDNYGTTTPVPTLLRNAMMSNDPVRFLHLLAQYGGYANIIIPSSATLDRLRFNHISHISLFAEYGDDLVASMTSDFVKDKKNIGSNEYL